MIGSRIFPDRESRPFGIRSNERTEAAVWGFISWSIRTLLRAGAEVRLAKARGPGAMPTFTGLDRGVIYTLAACSLFLAPSLPAQPLQLPTANHALFEKGGEERFFVGTVGKPWTTGTFG